MRKTMQCMTAGIFVLVVVLVAGCASGGQSSGSNTAGNPWAGLWEGKDAKGDIYSLRFTAGNWEMHIEKSGVTLPFYRGTYTSTATRVTLLVIEEGNYTTMGWMPLKSSFPPITGRLTGNVLNVPTFTEANLVKE